MTQQIYGGGFFMAGMSSQEGAVKPMAEKKKRKMSEGLKLLLLALPFVIFVFMFSYVPLGGWVYAFFDYRPGLSLADCQFVGLDVFAKIWQNRDELFRVLRNTLVLSGM